LLKEFTEGPWPLNLTKAVCRWNELDILVENQIIIELKAVEELCRAHYAQARAYLKAVNLEVGILVYFGKDWVDFRRVELFPPYF
jgi:GxxExxY protein